MSGLSGRHPTEPTMKLLLKFTLIYLLVMALGVAVSGWRGAWG